MVGEFGSEKGHVTLNIENVLVTLNISGNEKEHTTITLVVLNTVYITMFFSDTQKSIYKDGLNSKKEPVNFSANCLFCAAA